MSTKPVEALLSKSHCLKSRVTNKKQDDVSFLMFLVEFIIPMNDSATSAKLVIC